MKNSLIFFYLVLILAGLACHIVSCRKDEPCVNCPPPPCSTCPPPTYKQTIFLSAEDTGVTEAMLKLSISDTVRSRSYIVVRDSQRVFTGVLGSPDTLLLDSMLLPGKSYTYRAYRLRDTVRIDSSSTLMLRTMDTTSHDFTFQIDLLGDGNSSVLNDVTIINDTLAYAVGEIYYRDSTGQFNDPAYNAARWDGRRWNLMRILVRDFGSVTGYFRLKTVYGFSPDDIWFAGDADLIHWDGRTFSSRAFFGTSIPFNGQVLKMWGSSRLNLFCVGRSGAIYHYSDNGNSWQKLESGTTLDIQDIWGSQNRTGGWEILAVAGNYYVSNDRKILQISGPTVNTLSDSGIAWALNSVWFSPGKRYWVVGDGLWQKHFTLAAPRWEGGPNMITTYVTNRIRGTEMNDVLACGAFGEIVHFNGISFQSFRSRTALSAGQYLSVAVRGNNVFAVGYQSPGAVVARGIRVISRFERRSHLTR